MDIQKCTMQSFSVIGKECPTNDGDMECRVGCAACCVAPSISSSIPGMPQGKPAGVRCSMLTKDNQCSLFGKDERPAVCSSLRPSSEMCGNSYLEAYHYLEDLEKTTASTPTTK